MRTDWLDRLGVGAIVAVAILSLALLLLPAVIVVIMSFDTRGYISFPPAGFTLDWYYRLFQQPVLMNAMWTSIKVGLYVTALCIAFGVPTALACARGDFRGATALSVFVLLPHMVPGIVLGVAVLFAGALLGIGPSIWLQSISLACYVMAVMVRTVMARLQKLDPLLEQAAAKVLPTSGVGATIGRISIRWVAAARNCASGIAASGSRGVAVVGAGAGLPGAITRRCSHGDAASCTSTVATAAASCDVASAGRAGAGCAIGKGVPAVAGAAPGAVAIGIVGSGTMAGAILAVRSFGAAGAGVVGAAPATVGFASIGSGSAGAGTSAGKVQSPAIGAA